MNTHRKIIAAGVLVLAVSAGSGCTPNSNGADQDNKEPAILSVSPSLVPKVTTTPMPEATVTATPQAKSLSLIGQEIPVYDGSGRGFTVAGKEENADFRSHKELPLGLFIPESLMRMELNGSTAWGLDDKRNYITLLDADKSADPSKITGKDSSLSKYREYSGFFADGEGRVDIFKFQVNEHAYLAEIRTTADLREEMLPLFTTMLANIQYMEKREPLIAGVFIQDPKVGNSREEQQSLKVAMLCLKAIAAKDMDQFNSTLYAPGAANNMSYWVDNTNTYRFIKLTSAFNPENPKRVIYYVEYEFMNAEGYYRVNSIGMPVLLNKQGEWKVADLD
ncbi:hypothetical protein [Paenibacillus sp. sgz500958]|uniref:hypothetical protein n=1 Tax=Paenibacillus sp. sgz500958 TaxID=3242475 RepID=UPI0036D417E7